MCQINHYLICICPADSNIQKECSLYIDKDTSTMETELKVNRWVNSKFIEKSIHTWLREDNLDIQMNIKDENK